MGAKSSKINEEGKDNGNPTLLPENGGSVVVSTKYGMIKGQRIQYEETQKKSDANAFLGIPYARPPLGELRFRKPLPADPWDGVRPALKFPPQCPQVALPLFEPFIDSSEDCLYLNVFSPAESNGSLCPVMVYIHGGAYVCGSTKFYGDRGICQNFVVDHGIVVVTVQYRIGPLGFFSTGDDACDDNVGLWDMTLALQWVKNNIANFGGDATNVTIWGQSAGGTSVDLLSLSPHSRDLFQKVIAMAGNSNCDWALHENAVDKCRELAQKLGIYANNSSEMIEKLRQIPANKLVLSFLEDPSSLGNFSCPLGPRLDGHFFPKPLADLRNEAPKKARIVGQCEMEGIFFMILNAGPITLSQIQGIIAQRFPEKQYPNNFKSLRDVTMKMFIDDLVKEHKNKNTIDTAMAKLLSDLFTGIATQRHVDEQLALGNPQTFLYTFDHWNPHISRLFGFMIARKFPMQGAVHGAELIYMFNNVKLFGYYNPMSKEDEKVMRVICKLWSNFAKYDDPNGSEKEPNSLLEGGIKWDPVSEGQPQLNLSIGPSSRMKDHFQEGRPKKWVELLSGKC